MRQFKRTALSAAAAQAALLWSGVALAQSAPVPADAASSAPAPAAAASSAPAPAAAASAAQEVTQVVVTGQRAALQSAQKIKQNSDEIVDSIVAEDIGKLPDRSVTEVLQRVVGVTIGHLISNNDPEHYSVEGSGVNIRGLTYVRAELNGRDAFSANGGRSLNFEDVTPELMAGVDVYKNPSAEQIEGGIGGLVNLRTAMPFDFTGQKVSISLSEGYSTLAGKKSPKISGLYSNRWDLGSAGQFGALIDLAHSESNTRTDAFQVDPYFNVQSNGQSVWVPESASWRRVDFNNRRNGIYAALQWKKDTVSSSLTYFKSRYDQEWDENAIFTQASTPYNLTVDPGAKFSSGGVFQSGTLRDDADGGLNFGADTRVAKRKSDTQDISWNVNWRASDRWNFNADLQLVKATTRDFDSTVATGTQMAKETLDLSGGLPKLSFDSADLAALANPASYYWAFTMEHFDKGIATEKALKLDARYSFDDPVLSDLRFGIRLTDRGATTENSNPSYNWAAITQTWQKGWDITNLAYLSDPRFSGNTHLVSFSNFMNGKVSVPSLVMPDTSLAAGYPNTYETLHGYTNLLCVSGNTCGNWTPAAYGANNQAGTNDQGERTQTAYGQLRFAWDDWKVPVDGNLGLRMVRTESEAHGYVTYTAPSGIPSGTLTGVTIPTITAFAVEKDFKNTFNDFLPSLNLRAKPRDDLQFRFALARAMTRPDFSQLQAYMPLSTSFKNTGTDITSVSNTGTATGNPNLRPIKSNQADATAEWYFSRTGSLTFAAFDKELKDIIINQSYIVPVTDTSGNTVNFVTTGPVNGAKGYARGFELAYQQYFDKLPGFLSGFGMQANYTFVNTHTSLYSPVTATTCGSSNGADNFNLNLNGCDTNGQPFGNLPLQGVSRNSFNFALLYDQGPLSARVAYNWRSKYLQGVNVNGTQGTNGTDPANPTVHNIAWGLPTWADSYGEVDAGIFWKFDDHLTVGLEGTNLTDSTYKQLMQQHIGMMGRAWFTSGPSYNLQLRYTF
ncbi:MAG TPA: TonB-dependent receptor [Burkholderiaceae bacterium]